MTFLHEEGTLQRDPVQRLLSSHITLDESEGHRNHTRGEATTHPKHPVTWAMHFLCCQKNNSSTSTYTYEFHAAKYDTRRVKPRKAVYPARTLLAASSTTSTTYRRPHPYPGEPMRGPHGHGGMQILSVLQCGLHPAHHSPDTYHTNYVTDNYLTKVVVNTLLEGDKTAIRKSQQTLHQI